MRITWVKQGDLTGTVPAVPARTPHAPRTHPTRTPFVGPYQGAFAGGRQAVAAAGKRLEGGRVSK